VSRDASGAIPPRTESPLYRATLANPIYRQYLVDAAKLQIDGGVDGLFFDEVNGSYGGVAYDGNEGFDDLQIGDFNAFLLDRYPESTDFQALFAMEPGNILRRDVPANDINNNFNYRRYLSAKGWASAPMSSANPLAPLWGGTVGGLPDPAPTSFVDTVVTTKYWKEIADAVRAYARDKYGRKLLLTANGIWPHVDFQSVGLFDYNQHGTSAGSYVDYVPVVDGHLNGRLSLVKAFQWLKARSDQFEPGVPVVVFLDWPSSVMDRYDGLPTGERQDYWRLNAAEAYASGIFFALHLKTATGEPTATEAGTLDLLKSLAAYYRAHRTFFHSVTPVAASVSGLPASAMVQVTDQASPDRRLVHVVNHEYDQGFVEQKNLALAIPSVRAPARVTLASPDLDADRDLEFEFANGQVTLTLPSLLASATLVLSY
jgi:hypothetical protein